MKRKALVFRSKQALAFGRSLGLAAFAACVAFPALAVVELEKVMGRSLPGDGPITVRDGTAEQIFSPGR